MKAERLIGAFVVAAFLLGAIFIIFRDDKEPDKMPLIAGCFESQDSNTRLKLTEDGKINIGNLELPIHIIRDKTGLSVLPRKRIERNLDGTVITDYGTPLKIRISSDNNTLNFLDTDELTAFVRYDCDRISRLVD